MRSVRTFREPMMANRRCLFVVIAFGACCTALHAQTTYSLRESVPHVGTQITAEILRSPIPFNKSYQELSAEQLAVLRATYDKLGENDEPPFPEGGMAWIGKEIAKLPHRSLAHGTIVITVHVDEKGDGRSAAIYKTPDDALAKAIVSIVTVAKYKPAKCAGTPCAMDFPFIFEIGATN